MRLLKVWGDSLDPKYQDGDYVLVSRIPILLRCLRPGEAVAFRHSIYGTLIKLVSQVDWPRAEISVTGLHPASVDSRQFGPVRQGEIIGKVIWHIRKRDHGTGAGGGPGGVRSAGSRQPDGDRSAAAGDDPPGAGG